MSKKIFCLLIALLMVLTVSCVSAAEYGDNSTATVDEQVTLQMAIDDVQLESNDNDADVLSAGSKDPNLNIKPSCNDYGDVSFWASTEKNATGLVNAKFILLLPYGVEKVEVNENLTLKNGSVSWGGEGTFLPKGSYRVEATYYGDDNYASAYKATPDTGPDAFNVPKYHLNLNFTNLAVNEKGNIVANGQLDNENADGPYNMLFTNNDTGKSIIVYRLFVKDKAIIEYEGAPELGGGEYIVSIRYIGTDQFFPTLSEEKYIGVSDIVLNKTSIVLGVGDEIESGASLKPADAGNLTFASSNESVVTVDANTGVITAVGLGDATVTVSCAGNDKYGPAVNKTIAVSVKIPVNITVDPAEVALYIGENLTLNANLTPADAGNLTFVSSNPKVVNVTADGLIIAVGEGNANITVSFPGTEEYAASDVVVPVTVSLYDAIVSAEDMELTVGEKGTIDYTTDPEGLNVTFVPDDSGVVNVTDNGLVTAIKQGTANIAINVGDNKKYALNSTVITVTVSLYDASVSAEDMELTIGENGTIDYTTDPDGLNVTFVVDNSGVVEVSDDGTVTALKEGTAHITINVGDNETYALNSTVIAVTVSLIDASVSAEDMELTVGEKGTIDYTTDPDGLNVTFVVDNSGVVEVSDDGTVTALKEGTA
ncbi:Ig domain-containing protein, partial [Methanobrevibacter sp.]|uniref:Ig-like domain-containing protein n=1 Tax=Methanobrevibacter sp. TaxID=66852 RepID=UPI00388FBCD8